MKTLIAVVLAALLAMPAAAFPAFNTTIGDIPSMTMKWPKELEHMRQQIQTATQMMRDTQDVMRAVQAVQAFAGDPKHAIQNLHELGPILDSVSRMTGDEAFSDLARVADSGAMLMDSANEFRTTADQTIDVFGQSVNRDVSGLEATLALERVVNTARKYEKHEREVQKQLGDRIGANNKKIDEAIRNPGTMTANQMGALQLENQRLQTLLLMEQAKRQNAETAARMAKEQAEAAQRIAADKQRQEDRARGTVVSTAVTNQTSTYNQGVRNAMQPVESEAWDNNTMFGRRLVSLEGVGSGGNNPGGGNP